MAFHCGAPTRDGSACQRHVREPGTRCPQHRNLGGTALHPPRYTLRTVSLMNPALTNADAAWPAPPRDRVMSAPKEESEAAEPGNLDDEEAVATEDMKDAEKVAADAEKVAADGGGSGEAESTKVVIRLSYLDPDVRRQPAEAAAEAEAEAAAKVAEAVAKTAAAAGAEAGAEGGRQEPDEVDAEPAEPVIRLSYIEPELEPEPEPEPEPELELEPELEPEPEPGPEPEPEAEPEVAEPEPRIAEQRPQLRKERALDPDWIGARPLFRDEAPTRPLPRIEFEPSKDAEPGPPRRRPRIAPMRSVVLNPQADEVSPDSDPPTLVDRMPPIDPGELMVPEFLRPGFEAPKPMPVTTPAPPPAPTTPAPAPAPAAAAAAAAAAAPTTPLAPPAPAPTTPLVPPAPAPTTPLAPPAPRTPPAPVSHTKREREPKPAPAAVAARRPVPPGAEEITVPDFIVPGFSQLVPKPPLRTVLSTVLGPDLWQRCFAEWSSAHCTALARIARAIDGLAPSATTAVRSTAGAGMRWLGVAREREALAEEVAEAISHPAGATATNQARTVRLYGAAICIALNVPLRRCSCHRDLERDVSGELIRLGLEELAGEVP